MDRLVRWTISIVVILGATLSGGCSHTMPLSSALSNAANATHM